MSVEEKTTIPDIVDSHSEQLIRPIKLSDFDYGQVEECINIATLLGAALKAGLEIECTEGFKINFNNPSLPDSPEVSVGVTIFDQTAEYAARFFSENIDAPSPLALSLPTEAVATLYTSDSQEPLSAVLGLEITSPYVRFGALFSEGNLRRISVERPNYIDEQTALFREAVFTFLEGEVDKLELSQYISILDPLTQRTVHALEVVQRYKDLIPVAELPTTTQEAVESHLRTRLSELADVLQSQLEGEELTEFARQAPTMSTGEILNWFLKRSKMELSSDVLAMVREGVIKKKRHELSGRFNVLTGAELWLTSTENTGNTTHLLSQFGEKLREFSQDDGKQLIFWGLGLSAQLTVDLDNIAEVVRGKIRI